MASTNLTKIPALPPPPGSTSDFANGPTMLPAVIAGTTLIHLFTLPFMFARVYANAYVNKELRVEDYLSYLAYCGCIAYTATVLRAASLGMTLHMWDISQAMHADIMYACDIVFICYTTTSGLAKTVVFLELKRIFTTRLRGVIFWVVVGSLVANALIYTVVLVIFVSTTFHGAVEGVDSNKLNMAMGALNVASDVEAFVVPVWAIWQLNMELRQKMAILLVFGMGAIAIAVGCVGLYYRVMLLEQADYTWLLSQAALVCMTEICLVVVVGCCPSVSRIKRHLTKSSEGRPRQNQGPAVPVKVHSKFYPLDRYLTTTANDEEEEAAEAC